MPRGTQFDCEVYGQIRGLLEAWFSYGPMAHLNDAQPTPEQSKRLNQLADMLSLGFVLDHAQSPILEFIANLHR